MTVPTSAPTAAASGIQDMVNFALAQQGKTYSEAAGVRCGPNSYDCSGLVYASCVHANIRPPGGTAFCSTTFIQWADRSTNGNTAIPASGPFPYGSLIYFNTGSGAQPGHVGISLGDGTMMNALDTQSGVLVCPQTYGGTPMGGIALSGSIGLTSFLGTLGGAVGGYVLGPAGNAIGSNASLGGLISSLQNADKIAGFFQNPASMKRVGKGALAGALGIVAVFVLRGGLP